MAVGDDFDIYYTRKAIKHTSGTTVYDFQVFYSWVMDEIDEQAPISYSEPVEGFTPTVYTLLDGWFIDPESLKFLKGGAVETDASTNEILILELDKTNGFADPIASDIGKMVTDDAADVGPLLHYEVDPNGPDTGKWWIRDTESHGAIVDGSAMAITGGTGLGTADGGSVTGEDLDANAHTMGDCTNGLVYICQNKVKIAPDWWDADGLIDVILKVKEADVEIDEAKVTFYLHKYTDLYDMREVDLTAGGRTGVPLATYDDPNNNTAIATIMDLFDTILVMFVNGELAYASKVGDDPVRHMVLHDKTSHATAFLLDEGGESAATGTFELGDVEGTFGNTNDLEICSELRFDAQTAQFTVGNTVQGGTSSATAVVRRVIQDPQADGVKGILFITDISGGPFQDNETVAKQGGGGGSATTNIPTGVVSNTFDADVNGTITIDEEINKDLDNGNGAQPYNIVIDLNGETVKNMYELLKALTRRTCSIQMYTCDGASVTKVDGEQYQKAKDAYTPIKPAPFGTFAGVSFFGARGVWIESMDSDDSEKYELKDALDATQAPPTMATLKVTSMIATNDRVFLCESTGSGSLVEKKDQYTMVAQGSGVDYVTVSGAIADDAPPQGVVRVVVDYGGVTESEDIYDYTSIDRSGADDKFMISGVTSQAYDTDDRAFNPYLDKNADASGEAEQTVKFDANKFIVTKCRYKGYKTWKVAGQLLETGYLVTATRTVDGIYLPP